MARPPKLNPETHHKVVNLIRNGNYRETAAAAAGISAKTLRNWLHRAAKGGKANAEYVAFSEAMDEAEAHAEILDNNKISKAAEAGDWRAAAWRLARKNPARWGERTRLEHTGADGGPIETKQESGVVLMPPEDGTAGADTTRRDSGYVQLPPEDPADDGAEAT